MEDARKVIGIQMNTTKDGRISTILHLMGAFPAYSNNTAAGRNAVGNAVEVVYVGTVDCAHVKVGSIVDVIYDKAITTRKGTFQSVKRVELVKQQ